MKVAFFLFFPPTIWAPGGGAVQLDRSKAALERLGVHVSLFDHWKRPRDFDLLHVFGSNHEVSGLVGAARGLGIPTVVSAIYGAGASPWKGWVTAQVARRVPLTTVYDLRRRLLACADVVLAYSCAEAAALRSRFGLEASRVRVVHAGIDGDRFRDARAAAFTERHGLERFVLQVGRIRGSKGQSRLIRALDGLGLPLVIIGPEDPTDPEGVREFRSLLEGRPWVRYLGSIPHHDPILASAFKAARVHALTSTFESLGFVTLEAAAAGCAVTTGPYAPIVEYLGGRLHLLDPGSAASIRAVVQRAYEEGPDPGLAEFVCERYSWDAVARELASVYRAVLDRPRGERPVGA